MHQMKPIRRWGALLAGEKPRSQISALQRLQAAIEFSCPSQLDYRRKVQGVRVGAFDRAAANCVTVPKCICWLRLARHQ